MSLSVLNKKQKNKKNPGWLQVSLKSFRPISDQSVQFWLKELQHCQTLLTTSTFFDLIEKYVCFKKKATLMLVQLNLF